MSKYPQYKKEDIFRYAYGDKTIPPEAEKNFRCF